MVGMKNGKRVEIRKRESLIITVLFAILALSVTVGCASAATYTVCPRGGDGASIQAAINAADPGDTIEVHSGIYYELVNVKKQLTLRGVDTGGGKPAVDARLRGSAITLTADGITLEGFTVTNGTGMGMMEFLWTAGIRITSNNNIITNNTVSNSSRGITLCSWDPGNNSITGNNISSNKEGIGLWHSSSNNTFTGNIVCNNTYADVNIELSNNNTLTGNNISSNYRSIDLYCSSNNKIYLNNFINNTDNVHYWSRTNIWNSPEEIIYTHNGSTFTNYLGNYWDDYTRSDKNNDGIRRYTLQHRRR